MIKPEKYAENQFMLIFNKRQPHLFGTAVFKMKKCFQATSLFEIGSQ